MTIAIVKSYRLLAMQYNYREWLLKKKLYMYRHSHYSLRNYLNSKVNEVVYW